MIHQLTAERTLYFKTETMVFEAEQWKSVTFYKLCLYALILMTSCKMTH